MIIREEDCGTDRGISMPIGQHVDGQLIVHEHAETGVHARTLADDVLDARATWWWRVAPTSTRS